MDVVWTTGARVKRSTWFGDVFYEELSMKKDSVNLERMNKGAPLLNNHGNGGGLRDILGVVVQGSAKIVKNEGRATVQFSKRAEVADLIEDIRAGIIPNLSVGYKIDRMVELDEETEDGAPVFRAESWEPLEISFVTIPADMNAQARNMNQTGESHEAIVQRKEEETDMGIKKKPAVAKRSPGNPVHSESDDKKPAKSSLATQGADSEGSEEGSDELEGDLEADEVDDLDSSDIESEEVDDLAGLDDEESDEEQGEDEESDDVDAEDGDDEVTDEDAEEKPAVKKKAAKKTAKKAGKKKRSLSADEARGLEATRQATIRKQVRLAGLGEEFADELAGDTALNLRDAGKRIFAELEKRSSKPTMNQRIEGTGMKTELARRQAAVRGLLSRQDSATLPEKFRLKNDGDQEFRQGSLLAAARHFLATEGVRDAYTMSSTEVAQRSLLTTSDFANVLADVSNVNVRAGYDSIPATYEPFTAKKSVSNFKDIRSVEISNGGRLEKVNEHGEYRRTSLVEGQESYKLEKFGIVIGRTWELIMNDDIGALTDIPTKLGRRARELENITFWNLIMTNPTMADGNQFFSAAHFNVGTGGIVSTTTLGEARAKQRVMKDLDGELIAGLTPEWLINPAATETAIEAFLSPITPALTSSVNPFSGKLKQITEPLLDGNSTTAFYLFADKVRRAIAEMSLLDNRGPEIFTREGFNVDGFETKIRYVFGMGLVDWRGAFKNAGV